jgi:DNA-binding CsgD family transcriptional regulator
VLTVLLLRLTLSRSYPRHYINSHEPAADGIPQRPQESGVSTGGPEIDKSQPPDTDEEARPNPQLSAREAAILKTLIQGTPNKIIACRLMITEATVKVRVKAILRKIQVKNRTQAATWALRYLAFAERLGNNDGGSLLSAVTLVAVPSP